MDRAQRIAQRVAQIAGDDESWTEICEGISGNSSPCFFPPIAGHVLTWSTTAALANDVVQQIEVIKDTIKDIRDWSDLVVRASNVNEEIFQKIREAMEETRQNVFNLRHWIRDHSIGESTQDDRSIESIWNRTIEILDSEILTQAEADLAKIDGSTGSVAIQSYCRNVQHYRWFTPLGSYGVFLRGFYGEICGLNQQLVQFEPTISDAGGDLLADLDRKESELVSRWLETMPGRSQ